MSGDVPAGQTATGGRPEKSVPRGGFEAQVRRLLAQTQIDRAELLARMNPQGQGGTLTFLDGLLVPRDDVIRLCLSLSLGIEYTQRLLHLSGNRALDSKVLRDAAILFCIEKRFCVAKAQSFLRARDLAAI